MNDEELLKLKGKQYNLKNKSLLKYGGSIDSNGKIIHVITKKDLKGKIKDVIK